MQVGKFLTIGIVLTAAAGFAAAPALADQNILLNPGFESGSLSPWFQDETFQGTENWNVTSADAHTGSFSATCVGDRSIRQNFTPTPASQITQIGFWLRQPSVGGTIGDSGSVAVKFFFPGGPITFFRNTSNAWQFYDVTEFLPANETLQGISIFGYSDDFGGENRTFLDDLVVQVVPEPSAMLLCLLGLLSLPMRGRWA
jgi:hypothetical protein